MNVLRKSLRFIGVKKAVSVAAGAEGESDRASFTAEQVVKGGYEGILKRAADEPGIAVYARHLSAHPNDLPIFLADLLRSKESITRNGALLMGGANPVPVSATLVSLGTHCYTSDFLKRQKLKSWSGPFDWTFSSIPMIAHCVSDDFAMFGDPKFYRPVAVADRKDGPEYNRVNHAYYLSKFGVKNVFNHHDVHLPEHQGYMGRCVTRFKQSLRSDKPHAYVLHEIMTGESLAQLRKLSKALQAAGCAHRIIAVLVEPSPSGGLVPAIETLHHDAFLIVQKFTSVSQWMPLHFVEPIDEMVLSRLLRVAVNAHSPESESLPA